jgi:hypothetical protein
MDLESGTDLTCINKHVVLMQWWNVELATVLQPINTQVALIHG